MFLNLFRKNHYFVVYQTEQKESFKESEIESIDSLRQRRDYRNYLKKLQTQQPKPLPISERDLLIGKWIRRFFWWRGRRVKYFEPYTTKNTAQTYLIVGTINARTKIKRQALIFLLELYAHMENPLLSVTDDFKRLTREVDGVIVDIYKIKV